MLSNLCPVSAGCDNLVRVYSPHAFRQTKLLQRHSSYVSSLAEIASILISGSKDKTFLLWDTSRNYTLVRKFECYQCVYCLRPTPFDNVFVSSGIDETSVQFWHLKKRTVLSNHSTNGDEINTITFLSDEETFVMGT